jgi:iron complex transport system substrate-binding protein
MKRHPLWAGALSAALFLTAGCGIANAHSSSHRTPSHTITLVDDLHHTVVLKKPATRIIALEPSNAEIVLDLGLKPHLIGVDNSTLQYIPAPWRQQIRGVKSIGPSYPGINVEEVVAAKPDLVIAGQGIKGVNEGPNELAKFHIPVLNLEPTTLSGMYHDILLVGRATGRETQARRVVARLQRQFNQIETAVKKVKSKPTVFYDLGGYTTGPNTFLNALIDEAGAKNVGATLFKNQWPLWTAEQVVHANPDVILIDKGTTTVAKEDAIAGFSATRAVRRGRVLVVPQPSYTEEPSPALVMGLKELFKLLHPHVKVGD